MNMVDWQSKDVIELIKNFEKEPILWNEPAENYNKSMLQRKRFVAWLKISKKMNIETIAIKRKMKEILNSFEKEKLKGKTMINSQNGQNEVYLSKWFAFPHLSFLLKHGNSNENGTIDTFDLTNNVPYVENEPYEEEIFNESMDVEVNGIEGKAENNKKRKKKLKKSSNDKFMKALHIIEKTTTSNEESDESAVFAKYIAQKLRHYNIRTRNIVEHHINDILFKADMGEFETPYITQESMTVQTTHNNHIISNGITKDEIILS